MIRVPGAHNRERGSERKAEMATTKKLFLHLTIFPNQFLCTNYELFNLEVGWETTVII